MFCFPFCRISCHLYLVLPECNPVILTNCMTVFRHFYVFLTWAHRFIFCMRKTAAAGSHPGNSDRSRFTAFSKFLICKCFFFHCSRIITATSAVRKSETGWEAITPENPAIFDAQIMTMAKSRPDVLQRESARLPHFQSPGKCRWRQAQYRQTACR